MKQLIGIIFVLILLLVVCAAPAWTADVVVFADPALEEEVRGLIGKEEGDITTADVGGITTLDFSGVPEKTIASLKGIEAFTALESIRMNAQAIEDVSPLAGLDNLTYVELGDNLIADLEPLRGTHIQELVLYGNQIEDVSPLADIDGLEVLVLEGNNISDVAPLAGAASLHTLILGDNPIGDYTPLRDIYGQLKTMDFLLTKAEVVRFADPVLEQKVRDWYDRPTGDFYASELENEGYLGLGCDGGERITDLSGLEYFTNLEALELYGNAVTDLTPLAGLAHLRELSLSENNVEDLTPLAGLTEMEYLDLGGNRVSDLSALAGMNLVSLALWDNQVTDISPLAGMDNLEVLDLCNNQITDISALAGKTKLGFLSLGGNEIEDYSPVADVYDDIAEKDFDLDAATLLRREGKDPDEAIVFADPVLEQRLREALGIADGEPITAADAAGVQDLTLELSEETSTPKITDLGGMEYFTNLVSLNLGWALEDADSNFDLGPLAALTRLEVLQIHRDSIHDLSALSGLTNLRDLWIWGNDVTDLSPLAGLTKLEDIWMYGNFVTDISAFANMPDLYMILMASNQVTDLSPLAGLTNLIILEVNDNPIEDFSPIVDLYPNFIQCDFDINDVTVFDTADDPGEVIAFTDPVLEQRIRDALSIPVGDITAADAAGVYALDLHVDWSEELTEAEMIHNLEGLEYFINLHDLSLYTNAVSDLTPLAGLVHLEYLDFGANNVSDLSPLQNLTQLQTLTFYNNNVEDLSALGNLTQLRQLWLSQNPIADYTPIEAIYPLLESTDFEYGQKFERYYKPDDINAVVTFPDPVLEQKIRDFLGKPEGDITMEDVAFQEWLPLGCDGGAQITDLTGLESFLNLKQLELQNNDLHDLTPLAGLRKLEMLNLNNAGVTDISPLAGLTTLKWIDLSLNSVTDLSALGGLTNLYGLYLAFNPFTDYTPLADLYANLTEKDFEYGKQNLPDDAYEAITFPDAAMEAAIRDNLQAPEGDIIVKLVFSHGMLNIGNYTDAPKAEQIHDLTGIEYFSGLEWLEASNQSVSDLAPLAGLTKLTHLDLTNNAVTDVSALAGLTNLTELYLAGNLIEDYSPLAALYANLTEKDFTLEDASFVPDDPDAVVVFSDPLFESLVREQMEMPDGDITAADAARVTRLDFNMEWQEDIPDDVRIHDITGIEYFINLRSLALNFHAVGDISMLPALQKLTELDLGGNQYSDLRVFAGMPNLRRLALFGNEITDISPLAGLTQLTYLQMEHNQITDISALAGMTQLQTLWLTDNPIGDYAPIDAIVPGLLDKDF